MELLVPCRVNVCALRVFLDHLSTRCNLIVSYLFCGQNEEDRDHCFRLFPKVKIIWLKIWSYWRAPSLCNLCLLDIISGNSSFVKHKWVANIYFFIGLQIGLTIAGSHRTNGYKVLIIWIPHRCFIIFLFFIFYFFWTAS